MSRKLLSTFALFAVGIIGCTDPDPQNSDEDMNMTSRPDPTPECLDNEEYNEALGRCIALFPDLGMPDADMGGENNNTGNMTTPPGDMGDDDMDDPNCVEITVYLDNDGDGRGVDNAATNKTACLTPDEMEPGYARAAGDCDDNSRLRTPDGIEICDEVDNDCNDLLNDGIECVFYAHGPEGVDSPENSQGQFFTVDPFKKKVTYISEILNTDGSLLDIDTSPDGIIYGISAQSLYNYNRNLNAWVKVGDLQTSLQGANGLAIDRSGEAFATARAARYSVDLNSGRANKLGNLTGNVNSSGDCVVNKGDVLFMTSKQDDPNLPDDLIKIDRTNNTTEKIGTTSHSRIFGLTAAWGKLFGLTANGELIEIDQRTGASTLIEKFDGRVFYGAASTPER
jgi:hypothetical protein